MMLSMLPRVAIAFLVLAAGVSPPANASSQQARTILIPCKYPHGWTSTDASRDVSGTPSGYEHQCAFQYRPPGVIVVPCSEREVFDSINWGRDLLGSSLRVEYQCPSH
jgi:hypothetical protein